MSNMLSSFADPDVFHLIEDDNRKKQKQDFYFGHEVETCTRWPEILRQADELEDSTIRYDNVTIAHSFLHETKWAPCSDGSIVGVEYKSPLMHPQHEFPERVAKHINLSERNNSCGGHIHVHSPRFAQSTVVNRIQMFKWFFMLFYFKRSNNTYSLAKNQLNRKYNWLYAHHLHDTAEVRIFMSPPDTDTINFRMRLLLTMLTNEHSTTYADAIASFFTEANIAMLHSRLSFKTTRILRKRTENAAFQSSMASNMPYHRKSWGTVEHQLLTERMKLLEESHPRQEKTNVRTAEPENLQLTYELVYDT